MNTLSEIILSFFPLVSACLSMSFSQFLKTIIYLLKKERVSAHNIVSSGGMPSSHSALVAGLTVGVGLNDGWNSSTFAMCLIISLVVVFDAAFVRNAVGQQSSILSRIKGKVEPESNEKMIPVSGHTHLEIAAGLVVGFAVPFILFGLIQ